MKNAIRLHFDSILLFKNKSYPSAFQLSVLTLEEIAKSSWIDHYVYSSITNNGLPEPDSNEEQEWIKLLYIHTKKHFAFVNQNFHIINEDFYHFASESNLEFKKQKSIYVGLARQSKKIDTKSKILIPTQQIKIKDAKDLISLNNEALKNYCINNKNYYHDYGPLEKFNLLNDELHKQLKEIWKYKSKIIESRE